MMSKCEIDCGNVVKVNGMEYLLEVSSDQLNKWNLTSLFFKAPFFSIAS